MKEEIIEKVRGYFHDKTGGEMIETTLQTVHN